MTMTLDDPPPISLMPFIYNIYLFCSFYLFTELNINGFTLILSELSSQRNSLAGLMHRLAGWSDLLTDWLNLLVWLV